MLSRKGNLGLENRRKTTEDRIQMAEARPLIWEVGMRNREVERKMKMRSCEGKKLRNWGVQFS